MAKKRGRPSKYSKIDMTQVEAVAALGHDEEEIAIILGIGVSTLACYKNRHPEFLEALKRGKLKADLNVTKSLYNRASAAGLCPHCRQPIPGWGADTTAMIFWLKNRQRNNWRDRQDLEHGGKVQVDNKLVIEVVRTK